MSTYKCPHCTKTYKVKFNCDRHISICKFLSKDLRSQENEVELLSENMPTQFEMFQLIKHLSCKVDKLEKENEMMKQKQNKKINILEWLNKSTNIPSITFERWLIEEIQPLIPTVMETVYANDIITGINTIIDNYMSTTNGVLLPICSFNNKKGVLYIYESEEIGWKQISNIYFERCIEYLCNEFKVIFNETWVKPNETNIFNIERYNDMYVDYHRKLLGGNITKEMKCSRIRSHIYNRMKKNINGITEYVCD